MSSWRSRSSRIGRRIRPGPALRGLRGRLRRPAMLAGWTWPGWTSPRHRHLPRRRPGSCSAASWRSSCSRWSGWSPSWCSAGRHDGRRTRAGRTAGRGRRSPRLPGAPARLSRGAVRCRRRMAGADRGRRSVPCRIAGAHRTGAQPAAGRGRPGGHGGHDAAARRCRGCAGGRRAAGPDRRGRARPAPTRHRRRRSTASRPRLTFGGIVLERRAVGVTATYPQVTVTSDGEEAVAHVELPTFNCLTDQAPADPVAAGCVASLTESADLATPELTVTRDGGRRAHLRPVPDRPAAERGTARTDRPRLRAGDQRRAALRRSGRGPRARRRASWNWARTARGPRPRTTSCASGADAGGHGHRRAGAVRPTSGAPISVPSPPMPVQPHQGHRSVAVDEGEQPGAEHAAVGNHRELDLADRRVQPRGRPEEPAGPPVGLAGEQLAAATARARGDRGCERRGPTPSRPSTSRELRSLPISPSGCRAASARAVGSPIGSPVEPEPPRPAQRAQQAADAGGEQFRPGGVPGQQPRRGRGRVARDRRPDRAG